MRLQLLAIFLSGIISITAYAQEEASPTLSLGDPAPAFQVREWLKGSPIKKLEKGNVYVLEFWATWCGPCIASMPHLSQLKNQYKDKATFIAIDVLEKNTTPVKKVKDFVDGMGAKMDFAVAVEDSNYMTTNWLKSADYSGIPRTMVINAEGKLAWVGHPMNLGEVLPLIIDNAWDVKEALYQLNENKRLAKLDLEYSNILNKYVGNANKQDYIGKPDSALLLINEIVSKEPKLTYTPFMAAHTFSALLKTNAKAAYEYGKKVLVTSTYDEPAFRQIFWNVEWLSDKLELPAEIYALSAEAYQVKYDRMLVPEVVNIPALFNNMALMHYHANNKAKAIEAQQKAIEVGKTKKDFSNANMIAYQRRLRIYENMQEKQKTTPPNLMRR